LVGSPHIHNIVERKKIRAIVTVKLERNPNHNPQRKEIGLCPVTGKICTDKTGQHHSYIDEGTSLFDIETRAITRYKNVTRIEVI